MKNEFRVLIAAVLLLALRFLTTRHKVKENHYTVTPAGPTFDHDPMSITVNGQNAPPPASVTIRDATAPVQDTTRELNQTHVGDATPVIINVTQTDDPNSVRPTAQLHFYSDFDTSTSTLTPITAGIKISADNSTGGLPRGTAPVLNGVANFHVTFDSSLLPPPPDDAPQTPQYRKLYMVGSVTEGGVVRNCFQTITIYSVELT